MGRPAMTDAIDEVFPDESEEGKERIRLFLEVMEMERRLDEAEQG